MLTGIIVSLAAIVLLGFLFLYRKEMLINVFTSNMSTSTNQFTEHLEQTADVIIRRLEEEAVQLELLLEEAEIKIGMLSQQVEHANKIIEQMLDVEKRQKEVEIEKCREEVVNDHKNDNVLPAIEPENFEEHILIDNEMQPVDEQNDIDLSLLDMDIPEKSINVEKYRHIITMAEQGYTVTEIAKATGMGKGEIMLLLQLNK
ncbi:MAG: hypothetical protein H6Q72_1748 [Firmicutes bacterium]|nr:hypothetical protein [Bacillota bacterium]